MNVLPNALPYAAALVAALFSPWASAACYVVYGPDKDVVYRATEPPVDMSRPIHETLPLVAPGSTLVFSLDNYGCDQPINKLPLALASMPVAPAAMRPPRADRG